MPNLQPTKEKPIFCVQCEAIFSTEELTAKQYEALQQHHYWESLNNEWSMLCRVAELYENHQDMESLVQEFYEKELKSLFETSEAKRQGQKIDYERGDFDEPLLDSLTAPEREVMEYLRWHEFSLQPRRECVQQAIEERRDSLPQVVLCPQCKQGALKIDDSVWDDPNCIYD